MKNQEVCILDYGSGNVGSVYNLLNRLNYKIKISNESSDIKNSSHLILPGVGAFGDSIEKIKSKIPVDLLKDEVCSKKKPFLGICVGMQLLADISEENGIHNGFGWIEGRIKKLPNKNIKMPHMGWNNIKVVNKNPLIKPQENDYYFVHSYYFDCINKNDVVAETTYGINFASIINKENVYGCQFHPEKSSKQGLNIIKDFINL